MPLLILAYLGFIGVGLPDGLLGIAWPQMRTDFGVPLGAVGFLLITGTVGYVTASVSAGFMMSRIGVGWLLAASTGLSAASLAGTGLAPGLVVAVVATGGLGAANGAIDTGLNAYVARHYGARHLSWLHASFGLGAMIGPLIMTGVIAVGAAWRWGYGVEAAALGALSLAYLLTARSWQDRLLALRPQPAPVPGPAPMAAAAHEAGPAVPVGPVPVGPVPVGPVPVGPVPVGPVVPRPGWRTLALPGLWLGATAFLLQVAIEICVGLWAFTVLTEGRGLPDHLAGLAVSGYWASMFIGRIISGAVTNRLGVHRVLRAGIAGMAAGAVLVSVPGSGWFAVTGLVLIGFAAAPMFPLLTATTAERVGGLHADRTIGIQVGASAIGGAAVPAGLGVLIGAAGTAVFGPALLLLAGLLAVTYAASRRVRPDPPPSPDPPSPDPPSPDPPSPDPPVTPTAPAATDKT